MIRNNLQCCNAVHVYLLFLVLLDTSLAEDIGVYCGQYSDEGSLLEKCATDKYSYLNIALLDTFDNGQTPEMNLRGHCDAFQYGCTSVSSDIKVYQDLGIKVMLSVRRVKTFSPSHTTINAADFSDYLWNNFLGGNSSSRPLGDAILDDIVL